MSELLWFDVWSTTSDDEPTALVLQSSGKPVAIKAAAMHTHSNMPCFSNWPRC